MNNTMYNRQIDLTILTSSDLDKIVGGGGSNSKTKGHPTIGINPHNPNPIEFGWRGKNWGVTANHTGGTLDLNLAVLFTKSK